LLPGLATQWASPKLLLPLFDRVIAHNGRGSPSRGRSLEALSNDLGPGDCFSEDATREEISGVLSAWLKAR